MMTVRRRGAGRGIVGELAHAAGQQHTDVRLVQALVRGHRRGDLREQLVVGERHRQRQQRGRSAQAFLMEIEEKRDAVIRAKRLVHAFAVQESMIENGDARMCRIGNAAVHGDRRVQLAASLAQEIRSTVACAGRARPYHARTQHAADARRRSSHHRRHRHSFHRADGERRPPGRGGHRVHVRVAGVAARGRALRPRQQRRRRVGRRARAARARHRHRASICSRPPPTSRATRAPTSTCSGTLAWTWWRSPMPPPGSCTAAKSSAPASSWTRCSGPD